MISRLPFSVCLRFVGLLMVLFGTLGQSVPAAGQPREAVLRVADHKLGCSTPALGDHTEALPADVLLWPSGLGLPEGPPAMGLLPALPVALFNAIGSRCPLPYVRPVAYTSLVQARSLRTTLSPNAP